MTSGLYICCTHFVRVTLVVQPVFSTMHKPAPIISTKRSFDPPTYATSDHINYQQKAIMISQKDSTYLGKGILHPYTGENHSSQTISRTSQRSMEAIDAISFLNCLILNLFGSFFLVINFLFLVGKCIVAYYSQVLFMLQHCEH